MDVVLQVIPSPASPKTSLLAVIEGRHQRGGQCESMDVSILEFFSCSALTNTPTAHRPRVSQLNIANDDASLNRTSASHGKMTPLVAGSTHRYRATIKENTTRQIGNNGESDRERRAALEKQWRTVSASFGCLKRWKARRQGYGRVHGRPLTRTVASLGVIKQVTGHLAGVLNRRCLFSLPAS
jgi:hypothetical protein